MKILRVGQVRELDAYTIKSEPITSLNLMERASNAFVTWFTNQFVNTRPVHVFCGKGNNGGDGLAIARMLSLLSYDVRVSVVTYTTSASADFQSNLLRLQDHLQPQQLRSIQEFPAMDTNVVCIDALLGSGLSRPAEGLLAEVIARLNKLPNKLVAVDIASGLYADQPNQPDDIIIEPDHTVSFQIPKLAFMLPQNAKFTGEWHLVDIGLSAEYLQQAASPFHFTDRTVGESLVRRREKFSHKGTFGHALIIAGSYGKMGAAVLAGRACLRSGVGLLTMYFPSCGYDIMQISIPEAMALADSDAKCMTEIPDLDPYSAIGIGPGLGQNPLTAKALEKLLETVKVPMIIDADALNILSQNKQLLEKLPVNTLLTPHPKEFQRLVGESKNEYDRLELGRDFARKHQVIICLKGANTAVILPSGDVHFNSTGNAGMATGGTGDVLTGILTSLLAQQYNPADAAILGVYQHGLAGDMAAAQRGQSALIASDVVDCLGW